MSTAQLSESAKPHVDSSVAFLLKCSTCQWKLCSLTRPSVSRPPDQFIPPVQDPYAYIIFRASEVKDLAVDEGAQPQPPRRNLHDDPAVLGVSTSIPVCMTAADENIYGCKESKTRLSESAKTVWITRCLPSDILPAISVLRRMTYEYLFTQASAPIQQAPYGYGVPGGMQQPGPPPQPQVPIPPQQRQPPYQQGPIPPQQPGSSLQNGPPKPQRNSSVNSATASLETVERAIGDLRVDGPSGAPHGGRGGRRGGRHADNKAVELKVPTTDFDFESSNAKFDKSSLGPATTPSRPKSGDVTPNGDGDGDEAGEGDAAQKEKEKDPAYNPKKSFFDSLSSGASEQPAANRGRGGRRGGGGRNRREEERERNVATFGEPGGIGLMGPGAYVGGWGGYGRRGGGRGRRGGGPSGNPRQ